MPFVIQTSFSVAGLTSLDHHCRAIVFASRRALLATPDARSVQRGHLRRPEGGDAVLRQFHDVDAVGLALAEDAGHKVELPLPGLGVVFKVARLVLPAGIGHEDMNAGSYGRDRRGKLAGDDGSGESGLRPIEVELRTAAELLLRRAEGCRCR